MRTLWLTSWFGLTVLAALLSSAPSGRAGDGPGRYPSPGKLSVAGRGGPEGDLSDMYPPTERFRSPYLFPRGARAERSRDVWLYDDFYSPSILWIPANTLVRFRNGGRHTHTVTSDWMWESGELRPGESFNLIFTIPGNYRYRCRLHTRWMYGSITVY